MITIQNIKVDISALLSIEYKCNPKICNGECCSSYHVCITEKEIDRILPQLHEISEFAKHIKNNDVFTELFDEDEDEISIETNDKWQCRFLWKNKEEGLLCSLHSLAIKNNTSYYNIKPKPCCLWPLALSKEEPHTLTIQKETFPCIKEKNDNLLDPEIASIIKNIFGNDFLDELNKRIELLH